ncbi:MAG: GntR family transcriptional regulator [Caryophanon sp.]|nr:GntR family transcriptional regulator [Caryophanon sp.]
MTKLYDDVYALLEDRFMRGFYLPNESLSDSALSKELHISRNPIRRAMERLQAQGFLSATRHQSKLVLGYSDDDCKQLYMRILQLLETAIFHPTYICPPIEPLLITLKRYSIDETFYDYAALLAIIYDRLIAASDNDIAIEQFQHCHKSFVRMLTLRFRLGQLTHPFQEGQQLTQLVSLLKQQQIAQAKLYMRCIIDEFNLVPS